MNHISVDKVVAALEEIGNRVFAVEFTTDAGEYRKYSGRINVVKGVQGGPQGKAIAEGFKRNGVVPMKTPEGKYKAFKLHQVISLKCADTVVNA